MKDGVLSIEGEKKDEKKVKDKEWYYHLERSYGKFSRSFSLPELVDAEHIEAKLVDGVLELILKKNEKAKPKEIEVKIK